MPKFVHIRNYMEDGSVSSKGGYTIAYDPLTNDSFAFAVAKCHEKDNFNKKTGRNKAAGRLKSKNLWDVHVGCTSEQQFVEYLYNAF